MGGGSRQCCSFPVSRRGPAAPQEAEAQRPGQGGREAAASSGSSPGQRSLLTRRAHSWSREPLTHRLSQTSTHCFQNHREVGPMERLSSPVTCHREKWWCGGTPGLPARQQGLLTSHSLLCFFLMTPPVCQDRSVSTSKAHCPPLHSDTHRPARASPGDTVGGTDARGPLAGAR